MKRVVVGDFGLFECPDCHSDVVFVLKNHCITGYYCSLCNQDLGSEDVRDTPEASGDSPKEA